MQLIYIYSNISIHFFINLATKSSKKVETKTLQKRKASSINTKEKRLYHDTNSQITSEILIAEMVSDNNLQNRDNEILIKNLASSFTNPINESILNIELEERKLALLEC